MTTVVIARGRRVVRQPAKQVRIDDLRGPTGNYRAPIVRQGKTLVVGFAPEALSELLA